MEVESTLLVSKAIAEGFKRNPQHVQECLREAEASMNVVALERRRIVSAVPRLHEVRGSSVGRDLVELTFRAPTRAV